jgi:hypothetical protein
MCSSLEYSEIPNVDLAEFYNILHKLSSKELIFNLLLIMLLKIMKILIFTHILKKYINGIRKNVQNFRTISTSEKLKN